MLLEARTGSRSVNSLTKAPRGRVDLGPPSPRSTDCRVPNTVRPRIRKEGGELPPFSCLYCTTDLASRDRNSSSSFLNRNFHPIPLWRMQRMKSHLNT